jgi:Gas vesicle protein K
VSHPTARLAEKILNDPGGLDPFLRELEQINAGLPPRVNADPGNVEQGLAKLVLTLVELLRQLMERQAIRRMEAGSLTDDEIERLGQTFLLLEQRMNELKQTFGLTERDLNLDLGPLGKLV